MIIHNVRKQGLDIFVINFRDWYEIYLAQCLLYHRGFLFFDLRRSIYKNQ